MTLGALAALTPLPTLAAAAPRPPAGWDRERLAALVDRARRNKVAALMVVQGDRLVVGDGEVSRPFLLHSMRKSLLSALYGAAVAAGQVKLETTLGEIGIDDGPGLTDAEKRATIRDLLEARSGVYLPAAAEAPQMAEKRPARGSHPPGTFWYYNNWDFNVLGSIYERLTGKGIFVAFDHVFAKPLGMQDFDPYEHGVYQYEPQAPRYPAYHFIMSARDLARFGRLFLQKGRWNGRQLLPEAWVAESTRTVSRTDYPEAMSGYAYLWWTAGDEAAASTPGGVPLGSYTAAGAGGHFLTVMPSLDLLVVVRVNTFDETIRSPVGSPRNYSALLREVIAARKSA